MWRPEDTLVCHLHGAIHLLWDQVFHYTEAHQWTSPSDPPVSASPLLELQVRTAMPQVLGTKLKSSCLWDFTGWALGPRWHSCKSSCPLRPSTSYVSSLWAFDILVTKTDDTSEYTHNLPLTPTQRGETLLSMSMAGWRGRGRGTIPSKALKRLMPLVTGFILFVCFCVCLHEFM